MKQGSGSEAIVAVTAVFLAISLLTVSLRCYVRLRVVRAFGWDDGFMVVAMTLNVAFAICGFIGASYGMGGSPDIALYQPGDIKNALLCWWVGQIFYVVTCVVAKLSITISLLRITVSKMHSWILYSVMTLSVVGGLIFFFFTIFECSPVNYFWDRLTVDGKCLDTNLLLGIVYLYSAIAAFTDFTIGLLPIFIVWKLHMPRPSKIALAGILGLGCIACSAVIIRIPFLYKFKQPNFIFVCTQISIWSNIEAGLGITAGSLTTLRPLFRILRDGSVSGRSRIRTASFPLSRSGKPSRQWTGDELWGSSHDDDYRLTTTVVGRCSDEGQSNSGENITSGLKVERSFQISVSRA